MNILVLAGNTADSHPELDGYVKRLIDVLYCHHHTIGHIELAKKNSR
jgi:hypothetical protein